MLWNNSSRHLSGRSCMQQGCTWRWPVLKGEFCCLLIFIFFWNWLQVWTNGHHQFWDSSTHSVLKPEKQKLLEIFPAKWQHWILWLMISNSWQSARSCHKCIYNWNKAGREYVTITYDIKYVYYMYICIRICNNYLWPVFLNSGYERLGH